MAFSFMDIVAEAQLNGTWVDISGDVYQRDDIAITRGGQDESQQAPPTELRLTLDNRSGNYSTRNPAGAYYGSIGRNTPIRVGVRVDYDQFTRSASSIAAGAWGTSANNLGRPAGNVWSKQYSGGANAGTDWGVNGSMAYHSVSAVGTYRISAQAAAYTSADVRCDWQCALGTVIGGPIEPCNLVLNHDPNGTQHVMARVTVEVGNTISIALKTSGNTTLAGPVATGYTYTANTVYRVRAQWERNVYRAKVWPAASPEPAAWHVAQGDSSVRTFYAGLAGVRTGVDSANTNAMPIVVSYDNWEVRQIRAYGEAANFPAASDVTGRDQYVKLEASGISRRLGSSGTYPLQSAMFRAALKNTPAPVHYWPCEDAQGATGASNIVVPSAPLNVAVGTTTWSTYSGFDCSKSLPSFNKTDIWQAWTLGYTVTGVTQLRFLLYAPANAITNLSSIVDMKTNGSIALTRLIYGTGGTLRLIGYNANLGVVFDSGAVAFNIDGQKIRVDISLTENGSGGVDWKFATLGVGSSSGGYTTGTVGSQTVGPMNSVVFNADQGMQGVSIGHVMLYNAAVDLFAQAQQLNAYAGESPYLRMYRLAGEEGIELYYTAGPYSDSNLPMGSQLPKTLLQLLQEAAAMDMGYLTEARTFGGYIYVRRTDLYNQPVMLTASKSNHEIQGDWSGPVTDDQITRNDITLTRQGGGSYRSTLNSGRLSIASPPSGVGPYPASNTVNVQIDQYLRDLSGWQLGRSTIDRERYSSLSLDRRNVHVQANATLTAALNNVDVGHKVVVTGLSGIGIYDDAEQVCVGYVERLNRLVHTLALVTTPEEIYHAPVFDDGVSRWSPDNSTVNTGFNSLATSLLIDSAAGTPLWTTSAGDFPFDIVIGGERMTVSAITGSSTPQTFTVTRSINGVVKSHVAGEQVSLFRPVYLAL